MVNVIEFEENIEKLISRDFDPQTFFADFLTAVGAPPALLRQMEGQGTLFGDAPLLWRKKLHFLLAPKGRVQQCVNYLELHPDTKRHKPRILLSTDGEDVIARDTKSGDLLTCSYHKLSDNFGFFLPLADIERYKIAEENPVDVKATGRLAKFYDEVLRDNPTWKTEEKRHALNHFITQIIFCLFAEDTGIFPEKGMFTQTISTYCEQDSKAATEVIKNLFTAMATEEAKREGIPAYASRFPYVNGGLFRGTPDIPLFSKGSVRYLLDAGQLEWQYINPDIFGSMIQSIVNENQRAELGMHYTSVPNILKVLEPMFLDSLREQVAGGWNKPKSLYAVLERLGKIRVFDPACGSGNFLVIAYRELREIEISVIGRLKELENYSAPLWSHVKLENFFGIEYIDFAAETARLALWIAEYQMTTRYAAEFGQRPPALPLKDAGVIVQGNALRVNWERVCPVKIDEGIETYIVGNPPYLGSTWQNKEQKEDMKLIFGSLTDGFGILDYVAGWFVKAAEYSDRRASWAFVSTTSVCQGQQVIILFPILYKLKKVISFAHTGFKWKNNAAANAGVTVCIVGMTDSSHASDQKVLINGNTKIYSREISAYLYPGKNVFIEKASRPISSLPPLIGGNKPIDGGHLILSEEEAENLQSKYRHSSKWIRRFVGSDEVINDRKRFCLWISDADQMDALSIPEIRERVEKVKSLRLKSSDATAKKMAQKPYQFREFREAKERMLVIPAVSSESRNILPAAIMSADSIVNNKVFAVFDPELWVFAVFVSRMHYTWIDTVCGKLESRFNFSNVLGWNTFPMPRIDEHQKSQLNGAAEEILVARESYFDKSIADMYDPEVMHQRYPELWDAHLKNDCLVESLFTSTPFQNDLERLEHLFERYMNMIAERGAS